MAEEEYYELKRKLADLGYRNILPKEAVPLVECILADLLQTTRSLQHYMELSKEVLKQRDSITMEAEPYKCENTRLIQINNKLNKELMELKEENERLTLGNKRKIKSLTEELSRKDCLISKLKHDLRDLSLRGLCAETHSSRSKNRRKDTTDSVLIKSTCQFDRDETERELQEANKKMRALQERNEGFIDEIILLKKQLDNREKEIIRLSNVLEEGVRPQATLVKDSTRGRKLEELREQVHKLENANEILRIEMDQSLEKQHEAMLRALDLADKNKNLHEELQKVDAMALTVEEDCNKRLNEMKNHLNMLSSTNVNLTSTNMELHKKLSQTQENVAELQQLLNKIMIENDLLQKEIMNMKNKSLADNSTLMSQERLSGDHKEISCNIKNKELCTCLTVKEIHALIEDERKNYGKHLEEIKATLSDTLEQFTKHLHPSKDKSDSVQNISTNHADTTFIRNLHNKLCEAEQKILMLKKENDDFRHNIMKFEQGYKENYKDIISQLNTENIELSKENISLSRQLSQYKNSLAKGDNVNSDIQKVRSEVENLTKEIRILRKDKQEYKMRLKEAVDLVDKLKRDLAYKQKETEQLQEENFSYKTSNRTGKASSDHLREECNFLKEQIKKMQTDVIKEKTMSHQIKNIQLETERSSNELQNELLEVQRTLKLSKENVDCLEVKCRELQSENLSLKKERNMLIDDIKKIDKERDRLVIELDKETESVTILERKLKSETYTISKLENELSELNRMFNTNKISEHKLADMSSQIKFLNGEICRLTEKYKSSVEENKKLQNSLADSNGILKITKIEYEKSHREVEGLKQQLQHYVAEIRRIEELLSQKEAERTDLLEHFASLSVEANILENTNHSLESETVTKAHQLQSFINNIEQLESRLLEKECIIKDQATQIADMLCKISALENEVKLMTEEKLIMLQNISYLKKMCGNLQSDQRSNDTQEAELKLLQDKMKMFTSTRKALEEEKEDLKQKLMLIEKLLSNSRKETVELKLALQDATSETKHLQSRINRLLGPNDSFSHGGNRLPREDDKFSRGDDCELPRASYRFSERVVDNQEASSSKNNHDQIHMATVDLSEDMYPDPIHERDEIRSCSRYQKFQDRRLKYFHGTL